jgi:hypothetical protein
MIPSVQMRATYFMAVLLLIVLSTGTAAADPPGRFVQIGWECTQPVALARVKYSRALERARKDAGEQAASFERGVAFDLNGDNRKELLVPVACSGTGNCAWAIVSTATGHYLGVVEGEYLFIERGNRRWPQLKAYTRLGASEGSIVTYRYTRGRYRWAGDLLAVDKFRQNVPLAIVQAIPLCESLWNPGKLNSVLDTGAPPN